MRDEEGEEDDRNPKLFQCDIADFCFVGREVVCQWSRPDLRAKVAGSADEEAGEYQSLYRLSAYGRRSRDVVLPVGPLK